MGVARGQRFAPLRRQPLEVLQVELARLDAKEVARRARDEPRLVAGRRGEHLAQARHLVSQRVVGRVHALLGEELADQPVSRDHAVRTQQEQREQRSLLRASDRHGGSVHPNDEWTQDPELQAATASRVADFSSAGADASARARLGQLWDATADTSAVLYTAKCFWPGVTEEELRLAVARAQSEGGRARTTFRGASISPATSSSSACSTPRRVRT